MGGLSYRGQPLDGAAATAAGAGGHCSPTQLYRVTTLEQNLPVAGFKISFGPRLQPHKSGASPQHLSFSSRKQNIPNVPIAHAPRPALGTGLERRWAAASRLVTEAAVDAIHLTT